MELTVYRQAFKERPDGTTVYKGEDARPFVDDKIFFVADGLGGAAAIRHQAFTPDLFDRDKLMDTLFSGVYEKYDDERFVQYVTESFYELFAVKDCYTQNVNNIKKSGYFGSRIVTAILLHEMIYNSDLNPAKLFEVFDSFDSPEKMAGASKELGDYFATKIRDDMRLIAQNVNLVYESSFAGLALLGTTLCATIFYEKEDTVEALYLTAGDSRPYVWTEAGGLCQIVEDQALQNGGMANYIKANDGAAFSIRCDYMQFKKPCVLFNASDGCYDSGAFRSPMAFEKLILEKAVESDALEKAAESDISEEAAESDISEEAAESDKIVYMDESLEKAFVTYGTHDDSSTIAMKFFGYESFPSFQESAKRRLQTIQETYLSELPDLLDHDYVSDYRKSIATMPGRLSGLKDKYAKETAVRDFSVERMISSKYPPYESRRRSIEERKAEANRQITEASTAIEEIVVKNYSRFILFSAQGDIRVKARADKINGVYEEYQSEAAEYISLIEGYRLDFDDQAKRLKSIIQQFFEIGVPSGFSDYDEISFPVIEEYQNFTDGLFGFFDSIMRQKREEIRDMAQLRNEYIKQNRKFASGDEKNLRVICEMIIYGSIDLESIQGGIFQDDFESLRKELARIQDAKKLIALLDNEERPRAFKESRDAYWEEKYIEIITAVVSNVSVPIPDDLRAEAKAILDEMDAQTHELKEKAEKQAELFEQYYQSYGRYLGGNQ